jgi:ribosomal protein S9
MKREKTQISKIRNSNGEITINTKDIQGIIRETTLRTYIPINLKILKEWTNF